MLLLFQKFFCIREVQSIIKGIQANLSILKESPQIFIEIFILYSYQLKRMPKGSKGSDDDFEFKRKNEDFGFEADVRVKKEGKSDFYKCGDPPCGKFYHSYTAFYNHCKKSHNGEFPQNSLHNGKVFEGPSKNRGRPRIKKNQTKDESQIQSMKRQNELIEFLGTLKTKKMQQLIVHVENPSERLQKAIDCVLDWLNKQQTINEEKQQYFQNLLAFNKIVSQNDLPQFYDPIESELYKDNLDSYNFASVFNFMTSQDKRTKFNIFHEGNNLLNKILMIWLARIISEKLLTQVVYTVMIFQLGGEMVERQLLVGRIDRFKQICDKFFKCFVQQEKDVLKQQS